MNTGFIVEPIDHRSASTARQIHTVQMLAYIQEAVLLGVDHFPPLRRTVEDLRSTEERFLGASLENELVGAVSLSPGEDGLGFNIASLVVLPKYQRQGVAKSLIEAVVALYGSGDLAVETGVKNVPALRLYARYGFVEIRRWNADRELIELIKLRRPGAGVQYAA
jgi:ribosomal protein S18 acetylase RimI-like enzyme